MSNNLIQFPEDVYHAIDECAINQHPVTSSSALHAWYLEHRGHDFNNTDLTEHLIIQNISQSLRSVSFDDQDSLGQDQETIGSEIRSQHIQLSKKKIGSQFYPEIPILENQKALDTKINILPPETDKLLKEMFYKNNPTKKLLAITKDEENIRKLETRVEKRDSGDELESTNKRIRVLDNLQAPKTTGFKTAAGNDPKPGSPGNVLVKDQDEMNKEISKKILAGNAGEKCEDHIREIILGEILQKQLHVTKESIVGLEDVKELLTETILLPHLNPQLFSGPLFSPGKGVLLFGPPGNGKTMIGSWVASEMKRTFFSISASSLTSKWIGESEKLVRMLFAVAREMSPSIVFIDEVDSILNRRTSNENDASTRQKTEFLLQFDGVGSSDDDGVLIIGATNRPQELDEAARRRFTQRVYVRMPSNKDRECVINKLLKDQTHSISGENLTELGIRTEGFSCSDVKNLCRDAAFQVIREIRLKFGDDANEKIKSMNQDQLVIEMKHFEEALKSRKSSVSPEEIIHYENWNRQFGN